LDLTTDHRLAFSQTLSVSKRDRQLIRYLSAGGAVVVGGLIAAALTDSLGNTLATVLIGGGLLAFVIFLLRDMGLLDMSDKPPSQPPSRNGSDPHRGPSTESSSTPEHSPREARRTVTVRRPDRMRGQRRRLR
jgi:hypothetical protein